MRLAPVLLLLFCLPAEAQSAKPKKVKKVKRPAATKKVKKAKKKVVTVVKAKAKAKAAKTPRRYRPPPMPLQVVRPHRNFVARNRIVFVLDVSGSMLIGDRLQKAVDACMLFSSDEMQVAVITFNSTTARWAGVKDPCKHPKAAKCGRKCLPPAWARLPKHYPEVSSWVRSFKGSGGTQPVPALETALRMRRSGLMIVFVSDGDFTHNQNLCASAVKRMRKWRRKKKLDWVPILVWGVGENAKNQESLKRLAKVGGGGFYVHGKRNGPW